MSDYISRADAMGAVQDHFNDNGFKGYDDGQKMMDRIKALPSADAVEVDRTSEWVAVRREEYEDLIADAVQGEWENRNNDGVWATVDFAYCSVCKQPIIHKHSAPLWAFCPNCGARMGNDDDDLDGLKIIAIIDGIGGAE